MQDADTSTATIAPELPPQAPDALQPPPSPETSPAAPAAAVPAAEPAAPKSRRDVIAAAVKASGEAPADGKSLRDRMIERGIIKPAGEQPRAPDGKFQPKVVHGTKPSTAAAPQKALPANSSASAPAAVPGTVPPAAAATPTTAAAAKMALPKALRAELAPVWEKADPALQAAFSKYVADATRGIETYKTQAAEAAALMQEFKPYEALMRAEGGSPQTAIRSLMQTAYVLRAGTPAQKAQLIAQTMANFGVAPEHVSEALQHGVRPAQPQQQQPALDPVIADLRQRVEQLTSQISGQAERSYASIAEQFGRGKPHWDLLKPHVAGILSRGEIEGADSMNESQILEAAYTQALQQYPVISQAEAEAQRQAALKAERDRANAAAQAARQAAVQVTGAPGGAAAPAFDPKDRRSVLAHALRNAQR